MITIRSDDRKLYDPRIEELQLEEADLNQVKNKAGSLKLKIPACRADLENSIWPGITRVIVKEDDDIIFKGRVIRKSPDFWNDTEYTVEGDLAYLNDTVVRPYEFNGSPREYFAFLIAKHNEQVEDERKFTVGRVTVSDPNDLIVRSNKNYPSTWEELEEKLLNKMGGYLVERWEDGITYLDYLVEIREDNTQSVQYGENIIDIDRVNEIASDFATAVLPLGAKTEDSDGIEHYLTIESVNDGNDYVQDQEAVAQYGLILKVVEHEDVTLPENLLKKGMQDLKGAVKAYESITVTAADLSGTETSIESFRFMKNVRCVSKCHGLDFRSPIVSLNRNLLDRSDYKITIGDTKASYTGVSESSKRESENKTEEVISQEREARKEAIRKLVEKMEAASGLYVTDVEKNGTHDWYLHDKKTVQESYTIIHVNEAGITFSADGGVSYNGISWDGDAILNKIYAVGLDATYITSGTLIAKDAEGKTVFSVNVDTGEVQIDASSITMHSESLEEHLDGLQTAIDKSYTDATQTASEIITEAVKEYVKTNDLETLKQQLSTQFTQTAESIEMTFNQVTQRIQDLADDTSGEFSEFKSYIRFEDGNIILGKDDNPLILTLKNNRISFTSSGQEVAYFSDNRMYISNATITTSADIVGLKITMDDDGIFIDW